MKYNFDEVIQRTRTACVKWDGLENYFGTTDAIPLWVADMDFKSPPAVVDALRKRAEHGVYGYTMRPNSYYEAIINWMKKRHHWAIQKEWIAHSPGVVPALSLLIDTYTQPGDKVVIQPPVYHQFAQAISLQGRKIVENPLKLENGRYVMDFVDLENKLDSTTKMFILCSPHNPVGRVWTKEELMSLGQICMKHNVLIVSDEIHCDLVYKDYHHTPFGSLSPEFFEHSITCIAPSKTFNICGLQTSTLIIPKKELYTAYHQAITRWSIGSPNVFGAIALEAAYQNGEEWLDQLLDYLHDNLKFLIDYIEEHIPQIQVIKPEGTYLVWLDCRALVLNGGHQLGHFMLHEAKLALNEGHAFGVGGDGFMRMNIACPRSTLAQSLNRIRYAVESVKQTK